MPFGQIRKEPQYKCNECNEQFETDTDFYSHIAIRHGGENPNEKEPVYIDEYIDDYLDDYNLDGNNDKPIPPKKVTKITFKKQTKSPDDLFTEFQEQYHLPIYLTRKDLEQNPKNIKEINDLPADIRQIMIRYKRSKNDMDLYYKMTKRMETN